MPKAVDTKLPLQGAIFGLHKPSGMLPMKMLNEIKPMLANSALFCDPNAGPPISQPKRRHVIRDGSGTVFKIGQGGTLDPLAEGVMVVGVGKGTKQLQSFQKDCHKEYRTTALLGCTTDSYDFDGKIVRYAKHSHITREAIEGVLDRFRGEILQMPPVYSALKMDGMALYDYARTNTPLPRPIEARKVTVFDLKLIEWQEASAHTWSYPAGGLDDAARDQADRIEKLVKDKAPAEAVFLPGSNNEISSADAASASTEGPPPASTESTSTSMADVSRTAEEGVSPAAFTLQMTVSSGTYVRSIVHDVAAALSSAAFVVKLERTRQGDFVLDPDRPDVPEAKACIAWSVLKDAITAPKDKEKKLQDWEQQLLDVLEPAN